MIFRTVSMEEFKDQLSMQAYGMIRSVAWSRGICIRCKEPPTILSPAGRREYQISALCERCWDDEVGQLECEDD